MFEGSGIGGRCGAFTSVLLLVLVAACWENPEPPAACAPIQQVTVHAGESATVTACFTDPNGDMLTYSATSSNPSVATASISGASITVRAVAPGNASVTVTATDPGGLQGQQSFQVTVPNRPPVARGAISAITVQVGEAESVDVSSYFAEPDGEALTYAAASSRPGVATVSVSGSTVRVAAVAKGTATVTVTATDPGGLSATQVFETMVPNRRPEPVGTISDQTVEVGDPVTVNLSSYFNDPDGDPLTYTARSSVSAVAAVSVSGSTVTITARAKGATDVTITATDDGGLSATQSFGATVPNRPPVAEGTISDQTVHVGETATVNLTPYFDDPDGDALTYTASSSNSGVARVSVSGSNVTITAVAKGAVTVTVTARDSEGLSATQTFRSTAPNRAPVPAGTVPDETADVGEAVTLDLSPWFDDPDGDELTYMAASSNSGVARASVSGGTLTLTAVAAGSATITVTARDGDGGRATQAFGVNVTQPNRAPRPLGTIPAVTLAPGETSTIDASAYFTDPDGDDLTYTASSSNTGVARVSVSGSTVTITAVAVGSATITITARDPGGLAATQRANVTVTQTNRAPRPLGTIPAVTLAPGETSTIDASAYFTDPDGDDLTYTASSSNTGVARVSVSGSTVTITAVAVGSATITITARDPGGLAATQRANVTVTQTNRAPRPLGTIPAVTLAPGETSTIDASAYFTDPDGDDLTYTASSSNTGVARVSVSGSTVTITAVAAGSATITITARDPGGLAATQRANVNVTQPNRAPRPLGTIPAVTLAPGETSTIDASAYFTDPDGDDLTYTASSSNTGVARVSVSGSTVTITAVAAGSATITITARDPGGLAATQRANVTVTQTNRAPRPLGTIPAVTLAPGETSTIDASAYFTDPDGDDLTYTASSSNTGVARVSVSGSTVTITAVAAGSATITITARDPGGLAATQRANVTVTDDGGGAGFRDDFNSSASLNDWEITNATAEVSNGVLELTKTTSNLFGIAERDLESPIASWTIRARMGQVQTTDSTDSRVSLIWFTGHSRYMAFSFAIGRVGDNNYNVYVFDGQENLWVRLSDVSGDSDAINEGARELTTIMLSFTNGRFRAVAGSTELFNIAPSSTFAPALAKVTRIWLAGAGALRRTSLFDWIDVDGDAVDSAMLGDESPGLQLIDMRQITRKGPGINLPSVKSRAGRGDPEPFRPASPRQGRSQSRRSLGRMTAMNESAAPLRKAFSARRAGATTVLVLATVWSGAPALAQESRAPEPVGSHSHLDDRGGPVGELRPDAVRRGRDGFRVGQHPDHRGLGARIGRRDGVRERSGRSFGHPADRSHDPSAQPGAGARRDDPGPVSRSGSVDIDRPCPPISAIRRGMS